MSGDPLTSFASLVAAIEPGPRMVDASLLKQMYEIQGMPEKAAALDQGPRLVNEGDLRALATFMSEMLLVDTFQEDGERLIEGAAFKALAIAAETPPLPPPPVNTAAPVISGTASVGSTLTATTGTWTSTPTATYAYQWKRGFTNIGTNSSTYVVQAGDAGADISCVVTATNPGGATVSPPSNTIHIT